MFNHQLNIKIPFPEEKYAEIASRTLNVDKELKEDIIRRTITTNKNILIINFESTNAKSLRTSAQNLMELLHLITKTINDFKDS
ncbi:transcription factor Pcc1 [Neocallimastix lanati (nom. inval.)]|uniref:Transcription factor Pcc1 n=1 Tax=Neocallimastix californiae TaxID=1754190 RepID=A0A1Y2D410_9FUNG|nr:transcription factor Pcc1 [Neocallimastix sp. JGI-2020a]ORY54029.1 transcription factor Pcc1 [Neocallimastix californiae]|eukprot:ORY54029.1 transcription factor Pcc1 [Neocallimastix californiae]